MKRHRFALHVAPFVGDLGHIDANAQGTAVDADHLLRRQQGVLVLFHQFFGVDREGFPLPDVAKGANLFGCGVNGRCCGKEPLAVEVDLFHAVTHIAQSSQQEHRKREAPFAENEFDDPPQCAEHGQQAAVVFARRDRRSRFRFGRGRCCCGKFCRRSDRFDRVRRVLVCRRHLLLRRDVFFRSVRWLVRFGELGLHHAHRHIADGGLHSLAGRGLEFVVVVHEAGVLRVRTRRIKSLLLKSLRKRTMMLLSA